jgi:PAS domain-containing protein
MTPASKLQEHLKKRVQQTGGQYRKVRWEGRRGCPDCFIWWEWPRAAFVEVKADRDVLSALQRREIERMRHDGVPVFIVKTVEDIEEIVEKVRTL